MDEDFAEQINELNQNNLELLSRFSPAALAGGFIFGIVGFYFFRQGKRNQNLKVRLTGIVLMVYPLFFTEALPVWGLGLALSALAYYWQEQAT